MQPIKQEGYTATAFYRNISIHIADYKSYLTTGKLDFIWEGNVDSNGSNSDLLTVAPYLIDGLLDEFPYRSGKPNRRRVFMDRYNNSYDYDDFNENTSENFSSLPKSVSEQKTNLPNFRKAMPKYKKYSDEQILQAFRKKYPKLKNESDSKLIQLIEIKYRTK